MAANNIGGQFIVAPLLFLTLSLKFLTADDFYDNKMYEVLLKSQEKLFSFKAKLFFVTFSFLIKQHSVIYVIFLFISKPLSSNAVKNINVLLGMSM